MIHFNVTGLLFNWSESPISIKSQLISGFILLAIYSYQLALCQLDLLLINLIRCFLFPVIYIASFLNSTSLIKKFNFLIIRFKALNSIWEFYLKTINSPNAYFAHLFLFQLVLSSINHAKIFHAHGKVLKVDFSFPFVNFLNFIINSSMIEYAIIIVLYYLQEADYVRIFH